LDRIQLHSKMVVIVWGREWVMGTHDNGT